MLTASQKERYIRQTTLPELGENGQQKLLNAKVVCVGAGGLGSPALLYLAAAGVGQMGIVDNDTVSLTDLQRQIIHNSQRLGEVKTESARCSLDSLNPEVTVDCYPIRLDKSSAKSIFNLYDIIIDATDNFPTRYIIHDTSYLLGKPLVYGSIFKYEGQATVFLPGKDNPCYRCLFPEPPPDDLIPDCSVTGILGTVPGVIGTIQANECIKLITGIGEALIGRLLIYDALAMDFRIVSIDKNLRCPLCGSK